MSKKTYTPEHRVWQHYFNAAITFYANRGVQFTPDQVRRSVEATTPARPDHCNWWGIAFRSAAAAEIITAVDTSESVAPTRNGGLNRVWLGSRAAAEQRAAILRAELVSA